MKYKPENQMGWIPKNENASAIIKLLHLSIKPALYFLILLLLSSSDTFVTVIVLACKYSRRRALVVSVRDEPRP